MSTFLTQTITDVGGPIPGDCWRTAIACLLDFTSPLDVPHFIANDTDDGDDSTQWWIATTEFVAQHVPPGDVLHLLEPTFPVYVDPESGRPHAIGTGPSPRGDWLHSVLVDARTGELVWDPHPSRSGLAGPITDVAAIAPARSAS